MLNKYHQENSDILQYLIEFKSYYGGKFLNVLGQVIAWVVFLVVFGVLIALACYVPKAHAQVIAPAINIETIIQIESNGNPLAYNKSSGAIGLMQITPICLKEYNTLGIKHGSRLLSRRSLTLSDLYNPIYNKEIGIWYINKRIPQMLRHYKIPDTVINRLIAYNYGIGNLLKWFKNGEKFVALPKETQGYIRKYFKLIR